MALKVGELFATLNLEDSGFNKGLSSAKKALEDTAAKFAKSGTAMSLAITTPLTKIGKDIIGAGSSFEAMMSEVEAISGATEEDMKALNAVAKEMGATSVFSASEAAEGLKYMAMAGWDTEKMISGLPGIINLAASSGEDLGEVSDIVTDALTAFGMQASESAHFADILAMASNKSNTNVSLMGGSFKYAAAAAGALGYNAEDVAIALGLMANSGIKGEMAGTQLRTGMLRLASPTKDMATIIDKYGLSLTNADGSMKSFMEMMQMYRTKLGDLTEAEQAEAVSTLFGMEATAGWLAIINASESDFDNLTQSIYNAEGAAEDMAKVMIDNLSGDMTLFKSAVEGAAISLYELFSSNLRGIVQGATSLVTWFNGLSDGIKSTIVRIAAFAAAIGPAKLAIAGLLKGMAGALGIFQFIISPLGLAVAGMAALYKICKPLQRAVNKTWKFIKTFINGLGKGTSVFHTFRNAMLRSFGRDAFDGFMNAVETVKSAWDDFARWVHIVAMGVKMTFSAGAKQGGIFAGLIQSAQFLGGRIGHYLTLRFEEAVKSLKSLGGKAVEAVRGVNWSSIWDGVKNTWETLKSNIQSVLKKISIPIKAWFNTAGQKLSDVDWGKLWNGITGTYDSLKGKVLEMIGKIPSIINGLLADAKNFIEDGTFAKIGSALIEGIRLGVESKTGGAAAGIISAVGGLFSKIEWSDAGIVLDSFGNFLIDAIVTGVGAATTGATKLIEAIGGLLSSALSEENMANAVDFLSDFGTTIINAIVAGIGAVATGGSEIIKAIGSSIQGINWAEAGANLTQLAKNLISGIADAFLSDEVDFNSIMVNIGTGLADIASAAVEFGAGIAFEIVKGILDPQTWIKLGEVIGKLLDGIWQGVKAFTTKVTTFAEDNSVVTNEFGADVEEEVAGFIKLIEENPTEATVTMALNYALAPVTEPDANTQEQRTLLLQALKDGGYISENELSETGYDITIPVNTSLTPSDSAETQANTNTFVQGILSTTEEALKELNPEMEVPVTAEVSTVQASVLGEDAKEKFGQAGTDAGNLINTNMSAAMVANTSGITGAIDTLNTVVRNGLSKMSTGVRTIGYNFTKGLAQGILNGSHLVVSAAKTVAQAAVNSANRTLDEHSPSKIMMQSGKYFDEGFAIGITQNLRTVGKAASEMAAFAAEAVSMPNPGRGVYARNNQTVTMRQQPLDYDKLAEAMARVQLNMNYRGRTFAQISAEDTARAQNRRAQGIALGYGKR